jgi:hypothetical protein
MKVKSSIAGLACLLAGTFATFGQTVGLGLKFAATDPDAATSSLAPEETAGVVPQANWNNLTGATGSGVTGLSYDNGGAATASSATVTWSAPNTWRSGANNAFPDGPDRKLVSGYLDTGNTATTGVTITVNNLDSVFTGVAYDVYVYFVSDSNANRGGAYTINDGNTNIVKYGSTMGSPTAFVEDPGADQNLSVDGNYLVFRHLTGSSFTLTSDTTLTNPNGFRAPVNAVQIVPSPLFGPDFTTQPSPEALYAGRTALFSVVVDGFPAITSVKWQKDGVDLADGGKISGATTPNLTITGVQAGDVGNYTLVATSSRGSATSDPAALSIVTQENSAYVNALVSAGPLANWRLNEPDTTTNVFDFIGGFTGYYADGAAHGSAVEGPKPTDFPGFASDNSAMQIDPTIAPAFAQVPTPSLNTNTATFVAWINPAMAQANFTGIFMTRSGTQAGLGYTTDNQLGYTWNGNSSATWGFNSGLRPPDNLWSLAVLVVDTNRATIYLGSGGTILAAINPIPHTAEAWGDAARIGIDGTDTTRAFNGKIDEVAVFNRALSFDEVAALYAAATGTAQNPAPIISQQPVGATRYAGASVQFRAAATGVGNVTYQWKKGAANVADSARISGATTDTLNIRNLTTADAGDYTLVATDPNGSTTSSIATLTVLASPNAYVTEVVSDAPLSYWRFNETDDPTTGAAIAYDYMGGRDGTYGINAMNAAQGVAGPRPDQSFGAFEADNGALRPSLGIADSWVTTPALGIATNQMTFLAWINPTTRVANSGIIFVRNGQPATGLGLAGSGNLGYTWLDQAATYNFASNLTPPLNQWSLVAVAVEPTRAILYMINADGVKSATNTVAHAVRTFSDTIRIGGDPNNNNRTFDGVVDEAAIFDRALSQDELNHLFQRALGSVPPTIAASPATAEHFTGDTVTLTVSAVGTAPLTYRWEKNVNGVFQPVTNGGNISGADTANLTITGASAADAGEYRAIVTNALGTATSDSGVLTLLDAPPAPANGSFGASALGNGAYAYWRLNETGDPSAGTLQAFEYVGRRHGVYGVASTVGVPGPTPADGFSIFEDTNTALGLSAGLDNSWVTAPPLDITTNALTVVAWIKPTTLVNRAGIVFWRAGQPATGLGLTDTGNLSYHWLDTPETYNWDSGLTPPLDQWSLVALSVEPARATAYLINASGAQSATNNVTHAPRAFSDSLRIGNDPQDVNRTFDGTIDEVAIFDASLSGAQIQALYNGTIIPTEGGSLAISQNNGQITITWTGAGVLQSTTAVNGASTVWTDETTTGNSFTISAAGAAKFYRLKQ